MFFSADFAHAQHKAR